MRKTIGTTFYHSGEAPKTREYLPLIILGVNRLFDDLLSPI